MNLTHKQNNKLFEYDMIVKKFMDSLEASSLENGRFSSVVLDGIHGKSVLELGLLFVVFELNK